MDDPILRSICMCIRLSTSLGFMILIAVPHGLSSISSLYVCIVISSLYLLLDWCLYDLQLDGLDRHLSHARQADIPAPRQYSID